MARLRQRSLGPNDERNPVRRGRHGLSANEIDYIVAGQGFACAICRRTDRPLQVDHDHRHHPGTYGCKLCIRGMLCATCNGLLRMIADNPQIADAAAAYLRRFGS